jgi:glycosyltransferase involved in cell wall biosynthesis
LLVTNIGRFSSEKGQRLLLEAFTDVARARPERQLRLLLAGDGPTLQAVRDRARALGADRVMFPGRAEHVVDYLAASDIFVMPSDYEGMPNAMMEALMTGVACVSTRRSGAVDIAREGREALYVNPGDVAGLSTVITRLVDDAPERRRLAAAGEKRASDFTVSRMVRRFNEVLEQVLARPVAGPTMRTWQ